MPQVPGIHTSTNCMGPRVQFRQVWSVLRHSQTTELPRSNVVVANMLPFLPTITNRSKEATKSDEVLKQKSLTHPRLHLQTPPSSSRIPTLFLPSRKKKSKYFALHDEDSGSID